MASGKPLKCSDPQPWSQVAEAVTPDTRCRHWPDYTQWRTNGDRTLPQSAPWKPDPALPPPPPTTASSGKCRPLA